MTRDEIYDHLAQVYLGKRKKADQKKQKQFNAWLVINIFITFIIFSSAFYGLTAFLTHRNDLMQTNVMFSLHKGPIQMPYNFKDSMHPTEQFSLEVGQVDISKYSHIHFSVRAKEEGTPGVLKVGFRNKKNEVAYQYIRDIDMKWQDIDIPLTDFKEITDWSNLEDVSFILESWNVFKKKGLILIDDVSFSS